MKAAGWALVLWGGSALAQERPDHYRPVKGLMMAKAESALTARGFQCKEAEPPDQGEKARECILGGAAAAQTYTARLVGERQSGHLLSMTLNSLRPAKGAYSVEDAYKLIAAVATSLSYPGARPDEVAGWLERHFWEPLKVQDHPETVRNAKSGTVALPPPLDVSGVVFMIVGMPGSPGIDVSVKGY